MSNVAKVVIVIVLAMVGICVYVWDSATRKPSEEAGTTGTSEDVAGTTDEDWLNKLDEAPVTVGPPRDTDVETTVGEVKPPVQPPSVTTPGKGTQPSGTTPGSGTQPSRPPVAGPIDTGAGAEGFPKKYAVKSGDTLSKIAKEQYGDESKWKDIFEANKELLHGDADCLIVGMVLTLPKVEVRKPATTAPPEVPVSWKGKTHKVVAGDTLWSIAKKYYNIESKWELIYNENKSVIGDDPGRLREGMMLKIPELPATTPPKQDEDITGKRTHTVKEDENFWVIAEKLYGDGTKWQAIYEANKKRLSLTKPEDLKVGMVLVIPEIKKETE